MRRFLGTLLFLAALFQPAAALAVPRAKSTPTNHADFPDWLREMLQSPDPCQRWADEFSVDKGEHLKLCREDREGPFYEKKLREKDNEKRAEEARDKAEAQRPKARPVAKRVATPKPDGTSPYERMLVKEEKDFGEWKACDNARRQQVTEDVMAHLDAIGRVIKFGGPVPTPKPDPPVCDKTAWQADVLWLTSNAPPKGVKVYVDRTQFVDTGKVKP